MKKAFVLAVVSFICWLSCSKTPDTPTVAKPCVSSYDSTTTMDSYSEVDSFSVFYKMNTLDFKLKVVRLTGQSGTCAATPGCTNFLTITNKTNRTATIFYSYVGGPNVMIEPKSVKEVSVESGVFTAPNTTCISIAELKTSMKVRY